MVWFEARLAEAINLNLTFAVQASAAGDVTHTSQEVIK